MPVVGSWANNETGSVIICWGSGMVKKLVNQSTRKQHISCLLFLKELVKLFIRGPNKKFLGDLIHHGTRVHYGGRRGRAGGVKE